MDEPSIRRNMKRIAKDMLDLLDKDKIDAKTHGNLQGLAKELDRFGDDLSDSRVKHYLSLIAAMFAGGVVGYTSGAAIDLLWELIKSL